MQVHTGVERYWRKMLSSRSRSGGARGRRFIKLRRGFRYATKAAFGPTGLCRLSQYYKSTAEERSVGNPHATFCGIRSGELPPVTRWSGPLGLHPLPIASSVNVKVRV